MENPIGEIRRSYDPGLRPSYLHNGISYTGNATSLWPWPIETITRIVADDSEYKCVSLSNSMHAMAQGAIKSYVCTHHSPIAHNQLCTVHWGRSRHLLFITRLGLSNARWLARIRLESSRLHQTALKDTRHCCSTSQYPESTYVTRCIRMNGPSHYRRRDAKSTDLCDS